MNVWRNRIVGYGEEAPEQLLANPRNWRIHPKHQQDALAGVLDEIEWVQDVLVNKATGYVVDGHLRVAMAISKGEPTVPVKYVDLTEDEEAKVIATLDPIGALAVADASVLADLLAEVETENEAVQRLLDGIAAEAGIPLGDEPPEDPGAQMDRAAELQEKWRVKFGDVWEIPSKSVSGKAHRVLCGDSANAEDVARVMGNEKAQMLWTDPPYNIGYEGNYIQSGRILDKSGKIWGGKSFQDKIPDFGDWLRGAYLIINGMLGEGCAIYIWHPPGAEGRHFWDAWLWDDWHFQVDLVWDKTSLIISRWDYKPQHEPCMYGWKGKNRKWTGANNESTVWQLARQQGTSGGKREHPTEKPIGLATRAMNNHEPEIVFDPFLGSGTTLAACEITGRIGAGIEIAEKYVAVSLERLAELTGESPVCVPDQ